MTPEEQILLILREETEDNATRNALLTGGAVSGAYAIPQAIYHTSKDLEDFSRVPNTRSIRKFRSQLQPGDLLFHRNSYKSSPNLLTTPLTENQIMMLFKGDPYYHSSVYTGNGSVTEASSFREGIKRTRLSSDAAKAPSDYLAYRPKDPAASKEALKYLSRQVGGQYPEMNALAKHALTHLFDPTGGPPAQRCASGPRGLVCTELTASAYPEIAKKKYASPLEMRHSPEVELVARRQTAPKMSALEHFLSKMGYPLLKSLKYAVPAGLLAYAAT